MVCRIRDSPKRVVLSNCYDREKREENPFETSPLIKGSLPKKPVKIDIDFHFSCWFFREKREAEKIISLVVSLLFPFVVIVYHEELKFPYTERSLLWDNLAVFFTFSTGIAASVFIHYFYPDDISAAAFIADFLFTTGVMLNRFHKIYSKQKRV